MSTFLDDEIVLNPFTSELQLLALNVDHETPIEDGYILQWEAATGKFKPVSLGSATLANLILEEIPSGLINGINIIFTLLNGVNGQSLIVFLNGVRLQRVSSPTRRDQYSHTTGSSSFTMGIPPRAEGDGDYIVVTYIKT